MIESRVNNECMIKISEETSIITKTKQQDIYHIISKSCADGLIYHGIKCESGFLFVDQEGIKPLTPESNYSSHWHSGMNLFGNFENGVFSTYDSSFFNYAHSKPLGENRNLSIMSLAVANYDSLVRSNIILDKAIFEKYETIQEIIPRNMFKLLQARVNHPKISIERSTGLMCEQLMLNLLTCLVDQEYENYSKIILMCHI